MKNILVCGVANSGNLGDRIIAESLKHIIEIANEDYNVINFDLTNGLVKDCKKKSEVSLSSTKFTKKIIPNSFRRFKVRKLYQKNIKLKAELSSYLDNVDTVVIGGGHLLIDNYLNFALGINNIIKLAKIKNIPVVFAFVGAKGPWSKKGEELFLEALQYAKHIVVRDTDSKKFLISKCRAIESKIISISDPALYVKEICKVKNNKAKFKKIGLGIMDPNEMKRHSNYYWSRKDSAMWWNKLAEKLVSLGYEVSIFTNGASTDNGFVESYIKKELSNIKEVKFYNYPSDYRKLLNNIHDQDIIIAQRLHACLPAISLGKPTFGILWDRKLESIFDELGLSDNKILFSEPIELTLEKILLQLSKKDEVLDELNEVMNDKKREMLEFVRQKI